MKRTVLGTAVLLCAVTISAHTKQAQAVSTDIIALNYTKVMSASDHIELVSQTVTEITASADDDRKPTIHIVKNGDTLSSISKAHKTTWERLFYKNRKIESPDIITVGQTIAIPTAEEKLKPRKITVKRAEPVTRRPTATNASVSLTRSNTVRYSAPANSSGNRYVPGNCTWYVKNRRPDLPNNLGDAGTWVARARAQGLPTGSTPKVGAVGQSPGHVVYVEKVNGDGTILISDMNYRGLYIKTVRTVSASNYQYIY